ncbi:hypothetical protein HYS42_01285 [Candidatus Saccharibacteria bacterium]|nr:hypothetical protein [Candidatus Saccharibacteria bacterium]
MSVRLAKMLGKSEAEVAEFVERMEDKYGYPSHDLHLQSEVNHAARTKITDLGLDPHDTSAEELYQALQAKFAADAGQIDKALGIKTDAGFDERMPRAIEVAKHITGSAQVWALKSTTARKMLLNSPPKKLMKQLHYRTLDSMLKREDIGELFVLAPFAESNNWQSVMAKVAASRSSSDYALSPINFVHISASNYQNIVEPTDLNISDRITGSIAVWPSEKLSDTPVITMILMLLQSARQLGVSFSSKALAQIHPVLHWWFDIEHLISAHPEQPVSFNIADVAHNHLNHLPHKDGTTHHGAKLLWAELTERYQSMGDKIEDEIGKLMPPVLAAEYQRG